MKRKATIWEETFISDISDRALICKVYKLLKKQRRKKTNDLFKRWSKELNRDFTNEELKMAEKHLSKFFHSDFNIKKKLEYIYFIIHSKNPNNQSW